MEVAKEPATEDATASTAEVPTDNEPTKEGDGIAAAAQPITAATDEKPDDIDKALGDDKKKDEIEEGANAETPANDVAEDVDVKGVAPATEEKKKRKKADTSTPKEVSSVKRERRERKSVDSFNPEAYKKEDKAVLVVEGRGTELGELAATRASIEAKAKVVEDLATAHKLLFTLRGKAAKKDMLANVLAFSGYLPLKDESLDKKQQEAIDEECEVGDRERITVALSSSIQACHSQSAAHLSFCACIV